MSYRVTGISGHVEYLHDGRSVVPGERVSDVDAKKSQGLVDRGVLAKETERSKKPSAKSKTEPREAGKDAAAAPQDKEDSK